MGQTTTITEIAFLSGTTDLGEDTQMTKVGRSKSEGEPKDGHRTFPFYSRGEAEGQLKAGQDRCIRTHVALSPDPNCG